MKYHSTPIRGAKIQSTDNTKCWQSCGAMGTVNSLLARMKNGTATLIDNLAISYNIKHTLII